MTRERFPRRRGAGSRKAADVASPAPDLRRARRARPAACAPALLLLWALLALSPSVAPAGAQRGGDHILFGDLRVEGEERGDKLKPLSFEVILYTISGSMLARQVVPAGGRYRFHDLRNGHYDVAVEVENREVARVRVLVSSHYKTDFRQDISLEWSTDGGGRPARPQTVSAADFYKRTPANKSLFEKAQSAVDKQKYDQALALLRQLLAADPADFQAWTELGTLHLMRGDPVEAEQSYRRALSERPAFPLALLNLGRVLMSQKKYEAAVEPLDRAVQVQPDSPDANHLLGEAYLQIRKGSRAVGYLNEAIRLDPTGKADLHLRLASLYKAAGLKDKAAAEYKLFLDKRPAHPERKKLQQFIRENEGSKQ